MTTRLLSAVQSKAAVAFYAKNQGLQRELPQAFLDRGPRFGTVEFAERVAAFQAAHGLVVDGKAGRKETIPAIEAAFTATRWRHDCLIFRSGDFECPGVRVVNTYSPEGYDFSRYPGHVHGYFPGGQPSALLLHDSVTRTADSCFKVLLTRRGKDGKNMGLGTALMLSPSGTLYQCVPDLAAVTWHAGVWNRVAVGLDVIALLDVSLAPGSPLRRPATAWAPQGYLDYTLQQAEVLPKVVERLCELLGIPFECKRQADGRPAYCKASQVVPGLEPGTFSGVVAHAQVSAARYDGNLALAYTFGAPPSCSTTLVAEGLEGKGRGPETGEWSFPTRYQLGDAVGAASFDEASPAVLAGGDGAIADPFQSSSASLLLLREAPHEVAGAHGSE